MGEPKESFFVFSLFLVMNQNVKGERREKWVFFGLSNSFGRRVILHQLNLLSGKILASLWQRFALIFCRLSCSCYSMHMPHVSSGAFAYDSTQCSVLY